MACEIEDYEVLDVIGTGSFGTCYKVRNKLNKKIFVWKAIDYGKMSEETKQLLVSEVNLLRELNHPNIVKYFDRIIHRETTTVYIIMEWCQGGDLASLIIKHKKNGTLVCEQFVWRILYQTGRALQACHTRLSDVTVLHRDIKPANVFLDKFGNVKLGDFGLARILHGKDDCSETVVGTPFYMSPEIIKGKKYNRKSDIWALGCLVYELCALSPPFIGDDIKQLALSIKCGRFKRIPAFYSDDLQKIIELMLSTEHKFRPTIELILHHPTVVVNVSNKTVLTKPSVMIGVNITSDECANIKNKEKETKGSLDELQMIDKVKCLNFEEKEPEDVSQDIFKEKWLVRLEALRQKEAHLRKKEDSLINKERDLVNREKQITIIERLTKEKMSRAEIYLNRCRESRTSTSVLKSLKSQPMKADLDTSFSADPGDTSILPTSTKIDQKVFPFMRSASERRPKHVHFSSYSRRPLSGIREDRTQNDENKLKTCLKVNSNENITRNEPPSYEEERMIWLENKRAAYTTSNKENLKPKEEKAQVLKKEKSKPFFMSFRKKNNTFR
uniref:non-specific serine/threonine protein kinase n=1 Tax=Clastoptera arizonana TaxID=38151 RepID=A0A1B6CMC9_9HEMI